MKNDKDDERMEIVVMRGERLEYSLSARCFFERLYPDTRLGLRLHYD